jgi:hypothetical protein
MIQGAVLASLFGSGPVRHRYRPRPPGAADERSLTLCNLAVRTDAMLRFPAGLVGGEENAALDELSRRGLKMYYDPGLVVYHERRPTGIQFAKQMFKYGRGRGQLSTRRPRTLRPSYVVPAALVAYLAAMPMLVSLGLPALVPLALYAAVLAAASVRVAVWFQSPSAMLTAAPLFVGTHLSYGIGFWRGVVVDSFRRAAPLPDWRVSPVPTPAPTPPEVLAGPGRSGQT